MPKLTQPRVVLAVGMALSAAGVILMPILPGAELLILLGVTLCVASAAVSASEPRDGDPNGTSTARNGNAAAICVLSALVLVPLGVVGVLFIARADPLAIFLVGTGLFALSGLLATTFLIVFFMSRWARRRSLESTSGHIARNSA